MQARKVFFNSLANLATITLGGALAATGGDQINRAVQVNEKQESKKDTDMIGLPNINVNHIIFFVLGGGLGLAVKKLIEKSTKLNKANKELSDTISKLQKLENDDLPGIEKTLKEFAFKEGIKYETRNNGNSAESILGLLEAILIHINSYKEAAQPYLKELQELRAVFAGPFIEQLQSDGSIDAVTKEAMIQVSRGSKLTEYLETTILNALQKSGTGDKIGVNIANSLEGKDLLSNDCVIALKQAVTEVMRSNEVREALEYSVGANISEYDVAERLMEILLDRYKISLENDDPDIIGLKKAIAEALKKEDVSKKLGDTLKEIS